MATLNVISVSKKFVKAASAPNRIPFFRNAAETRIFAVKNELLREFDNHTVTKELLQNPNKPGSELVDHGNLVTFLGIPDGSIVVGELRDILETEIQLDKNPPKIRENRNKVFFDFKVKIPTKSSINEKFPSPDNYSSRSIIELIEKGIGNAASYIFSSLGFSFGNSRSGFGLQLVDKNGKPRKRKSGGSFKPMDYITGLIEKFKSKF